MLAVMIPDTSLEILAELRTIKWILVALLSVSLLFVYFAFRAAARFAIGAENVKENLEYQKFQKDTEGLLQRGSYEMAISGAKRRLEDYPADVYAQYYLAQALYHTDKLHEARRVFQKVAELSPAWQRAVDAWVERVEEKAGEAGPKVVK